MGLFIPVQSLSLPGDGVCNEHQLHIRKPGSCFLVIRHLPTYENLQLHLERLECGYCWCCNSVWEWQQKFDQLDCVWGQLGLPRYMCDVTGEMGLWPMDACGNVCGSHQNNTSMNMYAVYINKVLTLLHLPNKSSYCCWYYIDHSAITSYNELKSKQRFKLKYILFG